MTLSYARVVELKSWAEENLDLEGAALYEALYREAKKRWLPIVLSSTVEAYAKRTYMMLRHGTRGG